MPDCVYIKGVVACFITFDACMRYSAILFLVFLQFSKVWGQDTTVQNSPISFGLSPYLTLATDKKNNTENSVFGFGGDIFTSYRMGANYVQTKLGYKSYTYKTKYFSYKTESAQAQFTYKRKVSDIPDVNILVGYAPSFTINASRTFKGRKDSIPTLFYAKDLKNRLSHGIYVGLEFQAKGNNSMELGYTYVLNNNAQDFGVDEFLFDAMPSHLSFTYNINFASNANQPAEGFTTQNTLSALSTDTLYFINRACESDFSIKQLDSMLNAHYTFSAYRILKDTDIAHVQKQANVVHFAVIGNYYASEGDPTTSGIYLLDRDLNLTKHPYPFFTRDFSKGKAPANCMGSLKKVSATIILFNSRLKAML